MLMMSDLLAIADLQPGESYITIYPLRSAARHVVARTWPAGRHYRPGSVWTHSLILDYQALTLMADLVGLRSLFRMPEEGDLRHFGSALSIDADESSGTEVVPDNRIRFALQQLYGASSRRNVELPPSTSERDEILTLALWRQMWPSLRRDFSALTNRGDSPVSFDSGCTVRFVRHAFPPEDESDPVVSDGLDKLEDDFPSSGPTPLRNFLGRYVIEAPEPRRVATVLAGLSADGSLPAEIRLIRLQEFTGGAQLPRFKKDILTQELARIDNLADLLSLVCWARSEEADIETSRVVKLATSMSPLEVGKLISLIGPNGPNELGGRLFAALVEELPLNLLASAVQEGDRLRMAELRPELIKVGAFWPAQDAERAAIIQDLPSGLLGLQDAVALFGRSIGPLTVSALMHEVSDLAPDTLVQLLLVDQDPVRDATAAWVVSTAGRLGQVAEQRRNLDRRAIETLAGAQVGQGTLPDDPRVWAHLVLDGTRDSPSRVGALNVIAYLSALALDGEEAFRLAAFVYDPLNRTVRDRSLSRAEENYLSRRLSDFSRSSSLSKAVVQSALSKWPVTSSDVGAFGLTRSDTVRDEIVDEILARYGRSRLEEIVNLPQLPDRARAQINYRITKPKSKLKPSSYPWSWFFGD